MVQAALGSVASRRSRSLNGPPPSQAYHLLASGSWRSHAVEYCSEHLHNQQFHSRTTPNNREYAVQHRSEEIWHFVNPKFSFVDSQIIRTAELDSKEAGLFNFYLGSSILHAQYNAPSCRCLLNSSKLLRLCRSWYVQTEETAPNVSSESHLFKQRYGL